MLQSVTPNALLADQPGRTLTLAMHKRLLERLTVAGAVRYLLDSRQGDVKANTYYWYQSCAKYIVGPLLLGTRGDRIRFGRTGSVDGTAQFLEMLGHVTVDNLTTAQIRVWHRQLCNHVGLHTANAAKKMLRAALALAAEELHVRVPPMPVRFGRGQPKQVKMILSTEQIRLLLQTAWRDELMGIYYAFPFLTGARVSEQLALHWDDIDFNNGFIKIHRMQELNGAITEFTKTAASTREIPISSYLRQLLIKWRSDCPTFEAGHGRVFPCLGRVGYRRVGKTVLSYRNYLISYWNPALKALGLPPVTPHSARHSFISNLQALGIEVALVAKLAGHADVSVTLGHYTQAVRGGEPAVRALDEAYCVRSGPTKVD